MRAHGWRTGLLLVLCLSLAACVYRVRRVEVEPVSTTPAGVTVRSPVKAHLLDGSTVVYSRGVSVGSDSLRGEGVRYDLRLREIGNPQSVPLDSVAGMESFRTGIDRNASLMTSLAVTTAVAGSIVLYCTSRPKACFGSCPTFYSDSAGVWLLEAEGFSYSIAPLFETRDVDRLAVLPDAAGELKLEVRNEALETHYLNHLELLEIGHAADELVLPEPGAAPLAVRSLQAAVEAKDRAGRDVRAILQDVDGQFYETAPELLASALSHDMRDHIDLLFPAPHGVDSVAVVLRLRNSLLTTILLYDVMLGAQGARALDWLGSEMGQVGSVLELGQWYNRHMGLRISVWQDGEFRQVGRVGDTGPIAWKDLAVVVPVPTGDSLRVRLSFVTDGWRIDRVALATDVRRPRVRVIPAARVSNAEGGLEVEALQHVLEPDELYLQTTPGQRFTLHFETGSNRSTTPRTYLLASQGYYTEWIRPAWIRAAVEPTGFRPGDDPLFAAVERWRSQRQFFEQQFYETRIPVR